MRILKRRGTGAGWVENLLDQELAMAGATVSSADRGLVRELVFGVVRWEATLDWAQQLGRHPVIQAIESTGQFPNG